MHASFVTAGTPPAATPFRDGAGSSSLTDVRERWFGATGRKVPAVALEGTVDVGDALVVDGVEDDAALRAAHAAGRPVVARATDAAGVTEALARPEVSCVLVTDAALLELDLPELTYG
jgi:hypothetical protein